MILLRFRTFSMAFALAALIWCGAPIFAGGVAAQAADFGDLAKSVNTSGAPGKSDVAPAAANLIDAACDIRYGLLAASVGSPQKFESLLKEAETKLTDAANQLDKLSATPIYKASVPQPTAEKLKLIGVSVTTYGEILAEISRRARDSADAIKRMQDGKATGQDISLILDNEAVISRLVSIFFGFVQI